MAYLLNSYSNNSTHIFQCNLSRVAVDNVQMAYMIEKMDIPVDILESNRVNFLRGKNVQEKYEIGKRVSV